ncbi:MAG TPA: hypothetical protein VKD08_17245 [Ignavibacteriaceae bacterium]|jgi:hypothetical protein|nr:hypothetical protein [Ignavibacteriaceae bacterium]
MASIQSILAIGALVIFSIISLLFNSSVLQNTTIEVEDKVYLTAFSLADDLVEEMKQKAFDERTVDFQAINKVQLTPYVSFGPDGTETWPGYNDIDDYNGYKDTINTLPIAEGYVVQCDVNYCDATGSITINQDYYKKVTITVTSDYLRDPFQMYFIFSLHSKN